MKRRQLIELEDLSGYPAWLRNDQTDILEAVSRTLRFYDGCWPLLKELLLEYPHVLDLCSGGGGPWLHWLDRLPENVKVCLSDLYPNPRLLQRLSPPLSYHGESLDVRNLQAAPPGLRTLFTAIHHLPPEQVLGLMQDCARHGVPLAAFDFNHRSPLTILGILLFTPWLCALLTPSLRPFSWRRLVMTYFIPLIPLAVTWDGIASQFRAYTRQELGEMARQASHPDYHWEVGRRGLVNYLIGRPRGR